MNYLFRKYKSKDKRSVRNVLMSSIYFRKYTSKSLIYLIAYVAGVYRNYLYVLEEINNNEIVGAILLRNRIDEYFLSKDWWIYGVFIRKDRRGKGLGKILIQRSINELKRKNVSKVFLYVETENVRALGLYGKFGFRELETIVELNLRSDDLGTGQQEGFETQKISKIQNADYIRKNLYQNETDIGRFAYFRLNHAYAFFLTVLCYRKANCFVISRLKRFQNLFLTNCEDVAEAVNWIKSKGLIKGCRISAHLRNIKHSCLGKLRNEFDVKCSKIKMVRDI